MSARNKFVKVSLSVAEYDDVLARADAHGLTMCEHIRQQLLAATRHSTCAASCAPCVTR